MAAYRTLGGLARGLAKAPILLYRYTLSPLVGWRCRHLPTCSEYAIEAIDRNGAWKGGWQTLARLLRCNPWGSAGYDPVADLTAVRHPWWAPWRYGRWRLPDGVLTGSQAWRQKQSRAER